jgi:3D (Asp-Asp-Asp) domain-containing protein
MIKLILFVTLIGNFTTTSYRSVKSQTDSSPHFTSIGERVNSFGCAVSRDLLRNGTVKYGDLIYIESIGFKYINDTMHPRIKKQFDVWVDSYDAEKAFDQKFKGKKLRVWIIKIKT